MLGLSPFLAALVLREERALRMGEGRSEERASVPALNSIHVVLPPPPLPTSLPLGNHLRHCHLASVQNDVVGTWMCECKDSVAPNRAVPRQRLLNACQERHGWGGAGRECGGE